MIVLGLDPGSLHTGYAVVERRGSSLRALAFGRISCPPRDGVAERLAHLSRELDAILQAWHPVAAAVESTFHGRNTRSLIVLAQARGALLATLARHGIPARELAPAEVKSAVTGYGRAEKLQVARMVRIILALDAAKLSPDAADALAVAICYSQRAATDLMGLQARS